VLVVDAVTVVAVVDVGMVEVVVVVVVVVAEAVVMALVVVAVVDELQEAKAIDATRRKLSSAQIIPFFIYTLPLFHYIPFYTF
jgi:hypothetical protein